MHTCAKADMCTNGCRRRGRRARAPAGRQTNLQTQA
jgi:hypothetical protein